MVVKLRMRSFVQKKNETARGYKTDSNMRWEGMQNLGVLSRLLRAQIGSCVPVWMAIIIVVTSGDK